VVGSFGDVNLLTDNIPESQTRQVVIGAPHSCWARNSEAYFSLSITSRRRWKPGGGRSTTIVSDYAPLGGFRSLPVISASPTRIGCIRSSTGIKKPAASFLSEAAGFSTLQSFWDLDYCPTISARFRRFGNILTKPPDKPSATAHDGGGDGCRRFAHLSYGGYGGEH